MRENEGLSMGCKTAIPFDDIAVDDFEPEEKLCDLEELVNEELMVLSPWFLRFRGDSEIDPEEFAELFGQFWTMRGDVFFMEKAFLEIGGVVRGHPDFPYGVNFSNLKVIRLVRAVRQAIPAGLTEVEHIAHDLIIAITEEGLRFGFYSDNASRLCLS